jgi:NADH-quinone oxidoreductase subunit L
MAGPTPVSALIHAATMVTAGVYLLMRFFPVLALTPEVLAVIALVGAVTALFGACAALAQRDIKRVLAYSTISQVSLMFLGVGAGDVTGSMFQLLSHAFYKALLFLAAGCIIQALHEEHDIFRMGNLRQSLPAVFPLFLAGALSLGAIPPFGGYFSKDHILAATYSHPDLIYRVFWGLGIITSFLTPMYTFRLFFLLFLQKPVQTNGRENLPVPRLMVWVLWPLAILSIAAGALNFPALFFGSEWLAGYLAPIKGGDFFIPPPPAVEAMTLAVSAVVSILALVVAYFLYRPRAITPATPWRERLGQVFFSAFYLDRLYALAIAGPYRSISRFLWEQVDEGVWDSGLVETCRTLPALSTYFQMWTTGRLSYYLKMLFLGFTAILGAITLGWYRW